MATRGTQGRAAAERDPTGLTTGQRQLVELAEDWLRAKQLKASDR